jgi:membrane-bound ClpP family serine protease
MGKKKNDKEGGKLFVVGVAFFMLGSIMSYGIVLLFGVILMVAGMLPPSGKHDDPI